MDFLRFMVPRLDGGRMETDFSRYLDLVKNGAAGFIVFGGELEAVREGVRRLQEAASAPLIIASDLEQGLGQQVAGGTLFPPARAVARAGEGDRGLCRRAFACIAEEAAYVGMNTVFAPVLDVNSNPANPIIATRAFSEVPGEVAELGVEMMEAFRAGGIAACGKHFPGHGDTSVDSHLGLPSVDRPMPEMEGCELPPFRAAIRAGLGMVMLGHLRVPAIDPSGLPASLSEKAVRFLREDMGFEGVTVTDAMDMGALGAYAEEEAALMALRAGVDVLLHPRDPEGLARALEKKGVHFDSHRLVGFRKGLLSRPRDSVPPFAANAALSKEIAGKSIRAEGRIGPLGKPFVVILSDDEGEKGDAFVSGLRAGLPEVKCAVAGAGGEIPRLPREGDLIVAVFSETRAWKGGAAGWLREALLRLGGRASALVSFGSPGLMDVPGSPAARVYAWWGSDDAQEAAARVLLEAMGYD